MKSSEDIVHAVLAAGVIEAAMDELARAQVEEADGLSPALVTRPRFSAVRVVYEHIMSDGRTSTSASSPYDRHAPEHGHADSPETPLAASHAPQMLHAYAAAKGRCMRIARALSEMQGAAARTHAERAHRRRTPTPEAVRVARRAAVGLACGADLEARLCVFGHVSTAVADALRDAQTARADALWAHDAASQFMSAIARVSPHSWQPSPLERLRSDPTAAAHVARRHARTAGRLILRRLHKRGLRTLA